MHLAILMACFVVPQAGTVMTTAMAVGPSADRPKPTPMAQRPPPATGLPPTQGRRERTGVTPMRPMQWRGRHRVPAHFRLMVRNQRRRAAAAMYCSPPLGQAPRRMPAPVAARILLHQPLQLQCLSWQRLPGDLHLAKSHLLPSQHLTIQPLETRKHLL